MFGHVLFTGEWWKNSLIRAVRTALVIAATYVPGSLSESIPYITIALAAALGFVISFLTSLSGIPEADGKSEPEWLAILSRVAKSIAQAAIVACGTATLITEVNWATVGTYAISAGFGTLLLAVISSLPEVGDDSQKVAVVTTIPEVSEGTGSVAVVVESSANALTPTQIAALSEAKLRGTNSTSL